MSDQPPAAPRFSDGKDAGALRTIGEVADALDLKPHVLRYWELQFPMLKPLKRSGGRRYYRAEDVALVLRIDDLVNRQGFTLKGAKQALASDGDAPRTTGGDQSASASASGAPRMPVQAIAQLKSIRARLAAALAS